MKYITLGRTGLKVSAVGLGFWEIGSRAWGGSPEAAKNIVAKALELGINFFDTAEVYGNGRSEEALGMALRSLGAVDSAVVATKVGGFRPNAYLIVKGAQASVRRLGFRPALLQLHWPPPVWVPLCGVIRGLEEAVRRGLAEYIGVSNFPGNLLERAAQCLKSADIVSDQVEYSLAYRVPEIDVIPVANKLGAKVIAYSPLAKGALAGASPQKLVQRADRRYAATSSDAELQRVLEEIATAKGVSKSSIALAWLVSKAALPIPGTTRPEHVDELAAGGSLELSEDDIRKLDGASYRYRTAWGNRYANLRTMRYVPCLLQYIGLRAIGGA